MKNGKRIERQHRGKIKQYSPAKLERLFRYFGTCAKTEFCEGSHRVVIFKTAKGQKRFDLR